MREERCADAWDSDGCGFNSLFEMLGLLRGLQVVASGGDVVSILYLRCTPRADVAVLSAMRTFQFSI